MQIYARTLCHTILTQRRVCRRPIGLALIVVLIASGCIPASHPPTTKSDPPPKSDSIRPQTSMHPLLPSSCTVKLDKLKVRYQSLSDKMTDPSCALKGTVRMTAIARTEVSNLNAIRCELAAEFASWISDDLANLTSTHFGAKLASVHTMGSYACRRVIGVASSKMSEHSTANAVDVSAFTLSDGRTLRVEAGWNGSASEKRFWRGVRDSACQRFRVTLSPDFNQSHFDHLHIDMGQSRSCR